MLLEKSLNQLSQLSQIKSKMDHQVESKKIFTMKEKLENFRRSVEGRTPAEKGRLFMKVFGKQKNEKIYA